MSCFDLAIPGLLKAEGEYQKNYNDPGNWTSGKIGIGELKGTKYGISAASYPELDIFNLTIEDAKQIYKRDYWNKYHYEKILNQALANKIFNMCVNMGAEQAHKLAQRAVWAHTMTRDLIDDGELGEKTLAALNKWGISLLSAIRSEQAGFYRLLVKINPHQSGDLNGLLTRAYTT